MAFLTPDFQAIRDAILRDIANQNPDANVASDGDYAVRANANGAAVEGLYQHQGWIVRQIFPHTADLDYLLMHADRRGLSRKQATVSNGVIAFSGSAGSSVPVGTEAKTLGGVTYVTTAAGVLAAGGTVEVAAQALLAGSAGNQVAGTALSLTGAPAGVISSATIVEMTGGTDIESPDALLARLLFDLRNPPCGGAAHDYYTWAMDVDGVTAAYVYPKRRGLGTTDVVVMTAGGIPGAGLVAAVLAYINSVGPVQADHLVLAPTAKPVAVTGVLMLAAGFSLAEVVAAINASLSIYFAALKPGDTAYLHRIRSIISETPGVADFSLTAPTANVSAQVDGTHCELVTLGTPTWSS